MKVKSPHEIPYQIKFYTEDNGEPLGVVGTRMLIEDNEFFTDIGWFIVSKTAPEGTGARILKALELGQNFKSKKLVVGAKQTNPSICYLLKSFGFEEVMGRTNGGEPINTGKYVKRAKR